jgi:DNA polymerase III alpha subunit
LPDLDFGVAAGREDDVRAILVEMFGRERVANLAAVTTLRERGAIRTAATAFGYDRSQIRALHRKLQAQAPLDRYEQMIVHAAEAIAGQPHHLMQHASGVIVADEPLVNVYGVGTNADGPLLLADKDDVEHLQLLKFDILAWYLLAIYDQVEAAMHADRYPKPDLWQVAGEDRLTGDLLEVADTRCIPYLQSPAMMTLLRALRVRSEADIALALGALRPGASTTRDRLLAAIHGGTATLPGWEVLTPAHQRQLTEVLKPSRGAFIFDEDLLRVAHLLGLSLADAERLRKAMTKGSEHAVAMMRQLRAAALRTGWDDAEVKTVLHWFSFIERYTFTRGHAVALAHAAWRVARLAAHYPPQFYAAVLDHLGLGTGGGMYPILTYVVEARRHGLAVQGPTVNSAWHSIADGRAVHCGLRVLQSVVSAATLECLHAEARQRPFASIADLCARVRLTAVELEQLVMAGALDRFASSRRAARWEIQVVQGRVPFQPSLLTGESWPQPIVVEPESVIERAREEYETLGFTVSVDHPLELYPAEVTQLRPLGVAQLRDHLGRQVVVAGVVVAARRVRASTGRSMAFASICSADGTAEVTLFAAAATRYANLIQLGTLVAVRGVVTQDLERGIGIEVTEVRTIPSSCPQIMSETCEAH